MMPMGRYAAWRTLGILAITLSLVAVTGAGLPPSLDYHSYALSLYVRADGTCQERIDAAFVNNGTEPLEKVSFTVGKDIANLTVTASRTVSVTEREANWARIIIIAFDEPVPPGEEATYTIRFDTAQFTRFVGDELEVRTTYKAAWPIADFRARVDLPPGYVLPIAENVTQVASVVVPAARLETDGKHLILRWDQGPLDKGETMDIFVRAKLPPAPAPDGGDTADGVSILVAGIIAGAFGYALLVHLKAGPSVLAGFSLDERIVVCELAKHDAPMNQNDLCRALGFSKSKLSRLLSDLEDKSALTKERVGAVNRVTLDRALKEACRREAR